MKQKEQPASGLNGLDKSMAFALLCFALAIFVTSGVAAQGYLTGARLFPTALAIIGSLASIGGLWRVHRNTEPSVGPGQSLSPLKDRSVVLNEYKRTSYVLLGIVAYYIGVYLIGLVLATILYMFAFCAVYREGYTYAAVATALALFIMGILNWAIDIYLPAGLIIEAFR